MIIAGGPVAGDVPWRALARRGMLWSEVQAFDVLTLDDGEAVELGDPYYVEAVLCARGDLSGRDRASALSAGGLVVLAPGVPQRWTAGGAGAGASLVRLRLLPSRTATCLPRRTPVVEDPAR